LSDSRLLLLLLLLLLGLHRSRRFLRRQPHPFASHLGGRVLIGQQVEILLSHAELAMSRHNVGVLGVLLVQSVQLPPRR
jgi:hypothetical protein